MRPAPTEPAPPASSPRRHRWVEHLTVAAVASVVVAVALPGGAYADATQAAMALTVWAAIVVGVASGALSVAAVPRAAALPWATLAGLAMLAGLSIGWAADNGEALRESVRGAGYLGVLTLTVLIAARGRVPAAMRGLAFGLAAVCAVALASRCLPGALGDDAVRSFLPSASARLSYPLDYWNGVGAVAALAAVALTWAGASAATRGGRALATGATAVPALTLLLTSSRGGVLAAVAGTAVLLALSRRRAPLAATLALAAIAAAALVALAGTREAFLDGGAVSAAATREGAQMLVATAVAVALCAAARFGVDPVTLRARMPRAIGRAAAALAAVAVVAGLAAADPVERLDRFRAPPALGAVEQRGFVTDHLAATGGNGRWQFWEAGWRAFERRPALGIGAGGFGHWWAEHGSLAYHVRDAHSLPVETVAELGLAGGLLLLAFVGSVLAAGVAAGRSGRSAPARPAAVGAVAVFVAGLTSAAIDWTWDLPGATAPVLVAAGLAVAASPRPRANCRPVARRAATIAVVVAGCGGLAGAWLVAVSEHRLEESRAAARAGRPADAIEAARAARRVEPWASRPYLQIGLLEEQAGRPAAASAAIDAALARSHADWRLWTVAARIRFAAGELGPARAALARARRLNPLSPAAPRR